MSQSSVRSNRTLTPVEDLDHLEGVTLGARQVNSVPVSLTEPSGNAIFVQTEDKSIVDDIISSQSGETRAEPEMLQIESEISESNKSHTESRMTNLLKSRKTLPSVLKNAWKVNKQQEVPSSKRTGGYALSLDDSFSESDNAVHIASNQQNKNHVGMTKEAITFQDNEEDGDDNVTIADDRGISRKHSTAGKHESTTNRSDHIIDGTGSGNKYNESIAGTDFYDDIEGIDKSQFDDDDRLLETDAVSNHSKRVSMTSDSITLFKTEPVESRRSSIYYETNNSLDNNLHTTSPEIADERSIQVSKNKNSVSSKSLDDTFSHLSLEAVNNEERNTQKGGNKHTETPIVNKTVVDDENNNKEDILQEVVYLDTLPNNKVIKLVTEDDVIQKHTGESNCENVQSAMHCNSNLELYNKNIIDRSRTNANIRSDKQNIQSHAMTNIELADFPDEQTQSTDTVEISYNESSRSTDLQSIDSSEIVYGQRDLSTKYPQTWNSIDQNNSSDKFKMQPTQKEKQKEMIISAGDVKHTLVSGRHENWKRSITDESDLGVINNGLNLSLDGHSRQEVLTEGTNRLKTLSEVNVDEKENKTEERKDNVYSKYERVKGKDGTKSNSKTRTAEQSVKDSKLAPDTSQKQPLSSRQSNYKSIVEMKALERLLTGPYSEYLSKKTPSPRRGTYNKATKTSSNRMQQHDEYIKLAGVGKDNNMSKTRSETKDRVSSSRHQEGSSKGTGSTKSTNSDTNSSKSVFTEPPKAVRPVNAVTDQSSDNRTDPDESKTSAVGNHHDRHDQTETTTELITKESVFPPEKRDVSEAWVTQTLEQPATTETTNGTEAETNPIYKQDESVETTEHVEKSVPENTSKENLTILNYNETEMQDNDNSLNNKRENSEIVEKPHLDFGLAEYDTQTYKIEAPESGNKPPQERDWFMARTKIKALLPKLMNAKESTHTEHKRHRDKSLDVKEIFTKTNQDTKETDGFSIDKTEEASNLKPEDVKEIVVFAKKNIEKPTNTKTRNFKETIRSAMKKTKLQSNPKALNAKGSMGSAKRKRELPNSKIRNAKDTIGSATKKREEPSNPKTREPKEAVGSAKKKIEAPTTNTNRDANETKGSATKQRELPNPKIGESKETVGSAAKKTEEQLNPNIPDTNETNKPTMKIAEQQSILNIQNAKETPELDTEKTEASLVSKTRDIKETSKFTTAKTEEPPAPTDHLVTSPASIVIVDETVSPQTQNNFLIDQVIMKDILQKYKTKPTADCNDSFPNDTPGSPSHEPLIGNGVSKYQDCHPGKSVSIHSLAVPGLQPNPFFVDPPLDEDTISIYSRRDSVRQSFDSGSRKSVDYRIRNTALVVLPATEEKPKSVLTNEESFIKNAIPFLPMKLAVICLILNIFVPGAGTVLSGLAILCCGQPRVLNKDDQILITVCANCMVGVAQLCTITFLLVGWFWSVSWGIEMIILSVQHEKNLKEQRTKEIQSLALHAFGSPKRPVMFGT